MGMFWRITNGNYLPLHTLVLQESVGTLSPDWPFLWRLGQYHYLLEVTDPRWKDGFYIYSHTEKDSTLRFHHLVHTPYVMVSVGPEPKRIWAETRSKENLPLIYTGIRKPGLLVTKRDGVSRRFLKEHTKAANITWT